MRLFCLALFLTASCGPKPTYSVYGIDVYADTLHGPTKEQVKDHLDNFIYYLSTETFRSQQWIRDKIKGLKAIQFVAATWDVEIVDGRTYHTIGEYSLGHADIVVYLGNTCLGRTALTHELLHHMVWFLFETVDLDHAAYRWQPGGLCEVLEDKIIEATCVPTDRWIEEST